MSPNPLVVDTPRSHLMVPESAVVLKRFYFLERTLVLAQAGWLPAIEHWATKLALPELLWENAVFARELRQRILELRYPERRIALDHDTALIGILKNSCDAPNGLAFIRALAAVIRPFTRTLYERYAALADPLDDAPTLFFLRHALTDLDQQVRRLQPLADAYASTCPEQDAAAMSWTEAVRASLDRLPAEAFFGPPGDVQQLSATALPGAIPLSPRRTAVRDRRFQRVNFAWPDRHTPGNPGTDVRLQVRQAVHHVNEAWAAEMAAACLFDLADQAPAEFFEDAARWCFDEIRHCRMGYERLKAWGFADADIPLDTFSYDAGRDLDPITRLGIIFFFESTYIHTKPERTKIFGQLGDRLSSHDMDFDWADELIHTHYGKRWLEYFLGQAADGRTTARVKEVAHAAVVRIQTLATDADRTATDEIAARALALVGQH